MLWAQGMLGRAFRRVVDVGAGHGHLTRRVSAHLGVEALGLESDPERVEMARTLSAGARVEVVEVDVLGPDVAAQLGPHLGLSAEVLAMSLHGCGALADVLVRAAVEAQADVLLVACCPQKIRAPWRQPVTCLVHDGLPNLQLPREVLGLGNVLSRAEGIERPLASELATRQVRHALRYVLAARGLDVSLGEAMRGVNRRRAHGGLAALAAAALAVRGLSPPTADELTQATERARVSFPAARRLALPRSMLGRLLEVHLALDRAAYLEQAGYHVWVVELFPSEVSPRNLAIVGRAPTTTTTATTTTMATTTTTLAG